MPTEEKTELELLREIRDSQLRTEKMVKEFIESMANNPMMGMMAKMFGGKKG